MSWWWVWVRLCQSDYVIRFLFECVNVPVNRLRVSTSPIWLGFCKCESVRMHVKSMNVSMSLFLSALCCCSVTQSCPTLCNPWTAACRASLSFTISWSLLKLLSIESVMPSNHLILCCPFLLLPSIFPSIRVFSQWVQSFHQLAKGLEPQLQHQSFQWMFRTDFL